MKILTDSQVHDLSQALETYQEKFGEPVPRISTIQRLLITQGFDPERYKRFIHITRQTELESQEDILERLFGLVAETGEVYSILQKAARSGEDIDREHFISELGDVFYYFMSILDLHDVALSDVVDYNIVKLCKRLGLPYEDKVHHWQYNLGNK